MSNQQLKYQRAQSQYREIELAAQVARSSPQALVSLLYEHLIEALDVLRIRHARERTIRNDNQYQRATAIIVSLQAGLDFEHGGSLARSLSDIYQSIALKLNRALSEQDADLLITVQKSVEELAQSWRKIANDHA